MSTASYIIQNLDSKAGDVLVDAKALADRIKKLRSGQYEDVLSAINKTNLIHVYSEYRQSIQIANEYVKHQSMKTVNWGGDATFELTDIGHFWSDMVVNIKIGSMGVDISDRDLIVTADKYFYCDYPGVRLLESVEMTVDGNPIDKYTSDDVLFYQNFEVPPHKRTAWNRCIGQEQPKVGYKYYDNDAVREQTFILNGPQTLRPYQPELDLWIPLQFWFNKGIENALCSGGTATTSGQRYITIKLAKVTDIVNKVKYDGTSDGVEFQPPPILSCSLYVNHVIINSDIYDIFLDTIYFTVARLHHSMSVVVNNPTDSIWLNQFKYPTEHLYCGFRPLSQKVSFDGWYKFTRFNPKSIMAPILYYRKNSAAARVIGVPLVYDDSLPVVDSMGVSLGGKDRRLYDMTSTTFYNGFTPLRDGAIVAPDDPGMFLIQFNQKQLGNDITGFIDLSKIRNMHIDYTSSFIDVDNMAELVVSSRAINFLVISKTMSIKFAT